MSQTTVLACLGERRRPVKLASPSLSALDTGVRAVFSDVLLENSRNKLMFQRKDENWQGMFVDMSVDDEPISDRTVVNIIVVEEIHHHKPSVDCKEGSNQTVKLHEVQ